MGAPQTLFEKVWSDHLVKDETDETPAILYIDLQLVHEVTSPQDFSQLDGARSAHESRDVVVDEAMSP